MKRVNNNSFLDGRFLRLWDFLFLGSNDKIVGVHMTQISIGANFLIKRHFHVVFITYRDMERFRSQSHVFIFYYWYYFGFCDFIVTLSYVLAYYIAKPCSELRC